MTMFDWIDWSLLVLYTVAILGATYVLIAHRQYYAERFKLGVVNAFMLAVLFFLLAYDFKMAIAVWMRSSEVFGYRTPELHALQRILWLLAQVGTATGLVILSWITYRDRYDAWLDLRRPNKKGEDKK